MFDSVAAFERYRLQVVKQWPEGEFKRATAQAARAVLARSLREAPDRSAESALQGPAGISVDVASK